MAQSSSRRIRPFEAWRAMRILLRDKEDTAQVFRFVQALTGDSQRMGFERFKQSETGQRILREQRRLLDVLSDRAGLAKCPEGSLGRAYLDFVYGHNLSADGLVAASKEGSSRKFESADEELYANRLRDMHDLWHVTTGYGRDGLGELCLLAFSYAQTRNRGDRAGRNRKGSSRGTAIADYTCGVGGLPQRTSVRQSHRRGLGDAAARAA